MDTILSRAFGKLTPDPAERKNIFWLTVSALGGAGAGALGAITILTAYLLKSGFSNSKIGFISAAVQVVGLASGFAMMGVANRIHRRIRTVALCGFAGAVGGVLFAAVTALPRSLMPTTVLLVTIIIVLSMNTPAGALSQMMHYAVLVRTIHVHVRGRVWSVNCVASGVVAIVLSFVAAAVLKHWGYPYGYSICFLLGAGFGVMGAAAFGRQAELPDISVPATGRSAIPFVALVDMFRMKEFRILVYPHILRGLIMGIMVFVTPTQMTRLNLPNEYAGYMAAAGSASGLIGAVLLGLTFDRWGAGVVTLLGDIVASIACVALVVSPTPMSFLVLFFAYGVGDVLEARAIPLGAIEIVPPGIVAGFQSARLNVLYGSMALGSLIGGYLIDLYGAVIIFVVAAALKLGMGLWFLQVFGIRKHGPGAHPPAVAGDSELA